MWRPAQAGVAALCGVTVASQMLALLAPDHWCRDAHAEALASQLPLADEDVRRFSVPVTPSGEFSKCQRYGGDLVWAYVRWVMDHRPARPATHADQTPEVACDQGWNYNYSSLYPTITSELNWVCTNSWKPSMVHLSFWASASVGSLIWIYFIHLFGGKCLMITTLVLHCCGSTSVLLLFPSVSALFVGTSLVGFTYMGLLYHPLVRERRKSSKLENVTSLLLMQSSFMIGSLITIFAAGRVSSWWWLSLIPSVVCVLSIMLELGAACRETYLYFYKNSQESIIIMEDKENVSYDTNIQSISFELKLDKIEKSPQPLKHSSKDYYFGVLWMTAIFCYLTHVTGVTKLNTNSLKYNIPTIQLILLCNLMEIPSCIILILLYLYGAQYINKSIRCILSAVTGLICFLSWLIPSDSQMLNFGFILIGRLLATTNLISVRLLALHSTQVHYGFAEAIGSALVHCVYIATEIDGKKDFLISGIAAFLNLVMTVVIHAEPDKREEWFFGPLMFVQKCKSFALNPQNIINSSANCCNNEETNKESSLPYTILDQS